MCKKILLLLLVLTISTTQSQEKTLDIQPVYQETIVWCWVSVGEMIFKYNDICCINPAGNYQCGIIALLGPSCNVNCLNCIVPAGSAQRIKNMLSQYPTVAHNYCGSGKYSISSNIKNNRISSGSVITEIDNDRPIIAGISPSGGYGSEPAHVALIIGYATEDDDVYLIVNDPFPYELFPAPDPYLNAGGEFVSSGQYKILYSDFLKLHWTKSFVGIE